MKARNLGPQPRDRGARVLLITASLVLVVAGLRAVKTIALPLLLAVFLSILSAPLLKWLCARGIPKAVAVVATVLANVTVMAFFLLLIGGSINDFARDVPRYQQIVETRAEQWLDWLDRMGIDTSEYSWLREDSSFSEELMSGPADAEGAPEASPRPTRGAARPEGFINLSSILDVIGTTLRGIASILSMTLLVFLLMVFILVEAARLPRKLERAFGWRDETMERFAVEIQRYLVIKTVVSLATGVLVGAGMVVLGVDYPLLWGLTAFVFNYVPSVGSIVASVPPILLTLIDGGLGRALLVMLVYLAVNVTLGNFVEPHLMGRRFGISTLVVILSLIFWGWLWGPVGMLLSVPLTMIVKIMLENTEDFRWVAVLIGSGKASGALAGVPAAGVPADGVPAAGVPAAGASSSPPPPAAARTADARGADPSAG